MEKRSGRGSGREREEEREKVDLRNAIEKVIEEVRGRRG